MTWENEIRQHKIVKTTIKKKKKISFNTSCSPKPKTQYTNLKVEIWQTKPQRAGPKLPKWIAFCLVYVVLCFLNNKDCNVVWYYFSLQFFLMIRNLIIMKVFMVPKQKNLSWTYIYKVHEGHHAMWLLSLKSIVWTPIQLTR